MTNTPMLSPSSTWTTPAKSRSSSRRARSGGRRRNQRPKRAYTHSISDQSGSRHSPSRFREPVAGGGPDASGAGIGTGTGIGTVASAIIAVLCFVFCVVGRWLISLFVGAHSSTAA